MIRKSLFSLMTLTLAMVLLPRIAAAQHYEQTNLVSDLPGEAAVQDTDLVNPWGLARAPTGPWWVADNGTGKSTLYRANGAKQALIVTVPPATGSTPTGIVFHTGAGFEVVSGATHLPATFIFVTEDGTISGWNPTVNATNAIFTVNNAGTANYKGATLGTCGTTPDLYVANFESGHVDVFDSSWAQTNVAGEFVDTELPEGYVPFNVQNVGGSIFVMFALKGEEEEGGEAEEVAGRGLGYVDKFDGCGNLLMRLQHGPWMNAPWGIAISPGNFGHFSNNILVGNFGSGQIAAFDPATGEFLGRLLGERGPLSIEGLWAIAFGGGVNVVNNGEANDLFFTAGIEDEEHGLFGVLTPIVHGQGEEDEENEQGENHENEDER